MKRAVLQTKEKGASSWLTVIPTQEHGFALQNLNSEMYFEFDTFSNYKECLTVKNSIWTMPWIVKKLDLLLWDNNVREFEANLLKTIQNDAEIEPVLQKIDNERIDGCTGDEAGPGIGVRRVWRQEHKMLYSIFI